MGKTVTFELFVGALSTLVALVSAILLGAVRNEHIFPHENMRSLAITAVRHPLMAAACQKSNIKGSLLTKY